MGPKFAIGDLIAPRVAEFMFGSFYDMTSGEQIPVKECKWPAVVLEDPAEKPPILQGSTGPGLVILTCDIRVAYVPRLYAARFSLLSRALLSGEK